MIAGAIAPPRAIRKASTAQRAISDSAAWSGGRTAPPTHKFVRCNIVTFVMLCHLTAAHRTNGESGDRRRQPCPCHDAPRRGPSGSAPLGHASGGERVGQYV